MDAITIGKRIAARREALGMNRAELGVAARVSEQCVRTVETGSSNPNVSTLIRMAEALNCDLADLLSDESRKRV